MADEIKLQVKLVPDTKELEKILKKYQGTQVQVNATMPGGSGGASAGAATGGMASGIMGSAATAGIIIGALYSIKKGIDFVNENISELAEIMGDINPAFARVQELLDKTYKMALMPMSQLMTMLMKPYLQLMIGRMKEAREASKQYLEDYKAPGATADEKEAAMAGLLEIWKDAAKDMAGWQQSYSNETKDIVATIAGFKAGIELVTSTWLSSMDTWLVSFVEGLIEMGDGPTLFQERVDALIKAVDSGKIKFDALSPELQRMYLAGKAAADTLADPATGLDPIAEDITDRLGNVKDSFVTNMEIYQSAIGGAWTSMINFLNKLVNKKIVTYSQGITHYEVAKEGEKYSDVYSKDDEDETTDPLDDFISRPGQATQSFSPSDTIVGMKDISMLGGQGTGDVTINVYGTSEEVVGKIKKELINALDRYGRF